MEHLLTAWPEVAAQLGSARHILLLTDYDGTLTPIVARPEMADLAGETRQILRELTQQRRLTVGVISGRALPDLKEKVGISGIIYAGNHGLEIEGPGISFVNPVAERLKPILRILKQVLTRSLAAVRGVFVEDKGLSLSIHYRQAGENRAQEVEKIIREVAGGAEAAGQARITAGKKVYEVRPAVAWDKGRAIKLLMKRFGKGGRKSGLLAIYLGDDQTDEDGFRAIEAYGPGFSVFIGEPAPGGTARYYLKSPAEATLFLGLLLKQAKKELKTSD